MFDVRFIAVVLLSIAILGEAALMVYNIYFHSLKNFPGPKFASASYWYKTYHEVFRQTSWISLLAQLHEQYGPVIRLHFARPSAYNEIYNSNNRWDKEAFLYQSIAPDFSTFGYLRYVNAKERKDVLAPLFSRRATCKMQDLVQSHIDRLCEILARNNAAHRSSDLFLALRCYALDTITSFCFATSVDALGEPGFRAPIVEAMEAAPPVTIVFKHFPPIREAILNLPPWLGIRLSPKTAGLVLFDQMIRRQVDQIVRDPEILTDTPHPTIYHRLLDKDAHRSGVIPKTASLYEEAKTLVFGGTDTNGNVLMLGVFHLLENPKLLKRLKKELQTTWPNLQKSPRYEDLETLPFLTAVIKESLRISPGASSPLPRVIPATGATIDGVRVPPSTVVGMSGVFIHNNEDLFKNAMKFDPDRWLQSDSKELEKWLVPFSKGPRACLGQKCFLLYRHKNHRANY